ncbi:MAG: hypothetical protein KDD06_17600 [Phaeodactylibacter sp.]|nr:hypothetical protein [Phaeodactylibacter sp.]MCB9267598.1 hypothetical protein [Lewinellaceae bacterium]MCB9287927.1 hypothetical protein [Lewinellaceae bacterium]
MDLFSKKKKEPQTVEVKGNPLKCPVCGNDYFYYRKVLLSNRGLAFMDLEWASRRATCFVCSECSYIFWFDRS